MKRARSLGVLLIAMLFILGTILFAPKAEAVGNSVTFKLTTLDGRTITEKTYGNRLQFLVFYRSTLQESGDAVCYNSAAFLQSLAPALEQGWIQDFNIQIIMIGGDDASTTSELKKFVKKYAPDVSSKYVDFCGINEDLMWDVYGGGYLGYSYCALIQNGKVLEDAGYIYNAADLMGLLEGHADTGKLYQTVQVTSKLDSANAFDVLTKTNKERKAEGLTTLKMDKDLMDAAMQRAAEIATYFSHTRPSGKQCFDVHPKAYGENIAAGQVDAADVMDAWMNSPGHRANILGENYVTMGVGAAEINGRMFWVQLFGVEKYADAVVTRADYTTDKLVTKYPKVKISTSYLNGGGIGISLETPISAIKVGKTAAIKIDICDIYCYGMYATARPTSLTYTSSNTAVATVSEKGVITGVKAGSATITVRSKYSADTSPALMKIKITVEKKPAISTQPTDVTVAAGKEASFTVKATGGGLSYQWYYRTSESGDWKAVSSSAGKKATYALTTAARHDGYQYRCKVLNTVGNVYSEVVTLRVKPAITVHPVDVSVAVGKTAKFTVTAEGKDLAYQWYYRIGSTGTWKKVTAASGKTAAYSLSAAERHDGYQYRCKVSNGAGYAYSKTVTLTIK